MGKKLIIKGADFSENGIAPEFIELAWIGSGAANEAYFPIHNLTSNCKIVSSFNYYKSKVLNSPGVTYLFGQIKTNAWFALSQGPSDVYAYFSNQSSYIRAVGVNIGNGSDVELVLSKDSLVINGTEYQNSNPPQESYELTNFALDGAINATNGYINANSISADNSDPAMRLKGVKIYSDANDVTSLIVDAIPVKRVTDNAVCWYNKVDGTYIERADGSTPAYGELS